MKSKGRLAGRFLPSRVYARWIWIVRFGLTVVPLILFLEGSLVIYLTPSRYQSSVVFEYLGKRPLPEVEALLKSRNVLDRAVDGMDMSKRLAVSKSTATDMSAGLLETSVDAASGLIEVKATNTDKEFARDLAAEIPKALAAYESSLASGLVQSRIDALKTALINAGDEAEEKRKILAKLILIRGDAPADSVAALDVDAARRDWEDVGKRIHALKARLAEAGLELSDPPKWVVVHAVPQISDNPVGRDTDESLGSVTLQALGTGLVLALAIPYLLELSFPRRRRPTGTRGELGPDGAGLTGFPANG